MPRPVILFSGPFADMPLADLAAKAAEWGYAGLELCCWGDHLEVQHALGDPDYSAGRLALLADHDLQCPVIANHRVGQAVCDVIDDRHRSLLPDYVWGDGDTEGIRERAAAEMVATVRVAQSIGATCVSGFSGSAISSYVGGWPAPTEETVDRGFREFGRRCQPILDACRDAGIRFAYEVHPGQIAFDLYSAERALEALDGREEFGFLFDPAHLHWQGVDPVQFLRRFPDRIFHVHVKDAVLTLDGHSGVLNSLLPPGDPRRGWHFRSPGRGGIDWDAIVRTLNDIGYDGPLSVDWADAGLDREFGAEDACKFVKQLDVPGPAQPSSISRAITHGMETPETQPCRIEALRAEWTDQFVRANPDRPELKRFGETVGRVITVNFNAKAIVDFQDGGWYDIPAAPQYLVRVDPVEGKAKYDPKTNSSQPFPEKQS